MHSPLTGKNSPAVFVGRMRSNSAGCDRIRPRADSVDAIAEITSYAHYAEFINRLRSLGFHEDTSEGAPLLLLDSGWDNPRSHAARREHSGTFESLELLTRDWIAFEGRSCP